MNLPTYALAYAERHRYLTNKVSQLAALTRPTAIESACLENARMALRCHCLGAVRPALDHLLIDAPGPHPQPLAG